MVLFLASGCDENTEMLSCSSTNTQNGIVTRTKYDVEYVDDESDGLRIKARLTQDKDTTIDKLPYASSSTKQYLRSELDSESQVKAK